LARSNNIPARHKFFVRSQEYEGLYRKVREKSNYRAGSEMHFENKSGLNQENMAGGIRYVRRGFDFCGQS
jgi:hypothetical protein